MAGGRHNRFDELLPHQLIPFHEEEEEEEEDDEAEEPEVLDAVVQLLEDDAYFDEVGRILDEEEQVALLDNVYPH